MKRTNNIINIGLSPRKYCFNKNAKSNSSSDSFDEDLLITPDRLKIIIQTEIGIRE